MDNLNEILEILKESTPRVDDKKLVRIIFSLKSRLMKFGQDSIILSKRESIKFGISDNTFYKIIKTLINYGILRKVGERKLKTKENERYKKTHIYKLSNNFIQIFDDLVFYTKKAFQYINPLETIINLGAKLRYGIYKLRHNGNIYILNTKGRFKNVIYDTSNNKIINPKRLLI